jgi:uncharacterized peroxidase-related enzyme
MKTINVPTKEQVSPEAQQIFDQLQKRFGKVPNLLATVGYSANALKGLLDFEGLLNNGAFNFKQREGIALVVSEANKCGYCVASHTLKVSLQGGTKEEILAMRRADTDDSKLNAILQLAKSITENRGEVPEKLLEAFYEAGFDEKALIELIGLVSVRNFTNYVYAITNVPLDFPKAEDLN